jgi:hypothetical protein
VWATRTSAGLSIEGLLGWPKAVQGALLHDSLTGLLERDSQATFSDVEAMIGLCQASGARRNCLSGGIKAERVGRLLVLTAPGGRHPIPVLPQCTGEQPQVLPVPGSCELAAGWSLVAMTSPPAFDREPGDLIGPIAAEGGLRVRAPAEGDRIEAAGYSGPVKVSGLLAAARIPRLARSGWPLLEAQGRLVWVVGVRGERHSARAAAGGVWVALEPPGGSRRRWREWL